MQNRFRLKVKDTAISLTRPVTIMIPDVQAKDEYGGNTKEKMKYCEGDKVYVIVSNRWIKPGRIIKRDRDFLTVSLFEGGMIRLREGRFYDTEKHAQEALDKLKEYRLKWGIRRRTWRMG